ncbi:hypothetical protein RUM43_002075 [Polyplax serrata]|uniref:Uncharacterized protein n=1 Tax=Polyplax serrata TaxID=468196 RepID=A0AAN8PZ48_POLSC
MCRICLKEGDDFKSIFYNDEFASHQISVSSKIMACCSVQVVAGDGLPELICLDCLTQVDIAYDFKEKCQSADATLRRYITLVKPFYPPPEILNEMNVKIEESPGVKVQEKLDSKCNMTEYNVNNAESNSSTVQGNVNKVVENKSKMFAVVNTGNHRKKNREKTEETKQKSQKGGKKCQDEEGVSESDKRKKTKEDKDVKCPICEKTFAYLCILKDHMVQHTGAKPYLCSVCGKSFGHTASLTNHMKTHYSDKPHKCDRCELSFHRRAHLVLHMRTHTGEKPYVCDVCGRDFAQSSYLKEHMRLHSGEKPFVCDICGHGFARKSCLVMHRRVHTGELPYACPECGRAFSQRSQRKRHVKKNHKGSACLRATGELILKDLDMKNKKSNREELMSENSQTENSLALEQTGSDMQRDTSIGVQSYQSSTSNNPMIIYQQDNMSTLYPTTVIPLPLIQIQTTLLQ